LSIVTVDSRFDSLGPRGATQILNTHSTLLLVFDQIRYGARAIVLVMLFSLFWQQIFHISTFAAAGDAKLETTLGENANRLQDLRKQISLSEARKSELAEEISNVEKDRAAINRRLIQSATKSRKLEKNIDKTGLRLSELEADDALLRESLYGRKALLTEVLAALQRLGRNPPPALLVSPEDALSSVRSAILLGAVIPEIRAESQILLNELKELAQVTGEITDNRNKLSSDLQAQAEEEERLTLLLTEKQKIASNARTELAEESAKVAALAANATSLGRLIDNLESQIKGVKKAAQAARQAEEKRRINKQNRIAAGRQEIEKPNFSDTGRITPAISFDAAKGILPRPVGGVVTTAFGQKDGFGVAANGLSMATRINARIISPADAWVVYSGPFRSYGQLLILNAGNGYHIVLAGMENTYVKLGQFVLTGEPIGIMGARRVASANTSIVGSTRPVLYVEFRKDGKSIDPSPWWRDASTKRALDDS